MREREGEREGERGKGNSLLLIHSIFVVAFIFFFTLRTVYVFCIRYKKLKPSAITGIYLEVSSG